MGLPPPLLATGPAGPVSTSRFEMFREGLQECEARIFIEKALLDPAKRKKLGEELAGRCQELLDERVRNMRRAVCSFQARSGSGDRRCYTPSSWFNFAPLLGSHWYASSDWQGEIEKLYEAAAEVEAKVGRE